MHKSQFHQTDPHELVLCSRLTCVTVIDLFNLTSCCGLTVFGEGERTMFPLLAAALLHPAQLRQRQLGGDAGGQRELVVSAGGSLQLQTCGETDRARSESSRHGQSTLRVQRTRTRSSSLSLSPRSLTSDAEAAGVQRRSLRRRHVHLQIQLLQRPAVDLSHVLPAWP